MNCATALESRLAAGRLLFDVALAPENGEGLHWLHENTEVMAKSVSADGALHLTVRVAPERADAVRRRFFAAAPSEKLALEPAREIPAKRATRR